MGIEKYFGFLGEETDHWALRLVQENPFIGNPTRPRYHLTKDPWDRNIAGFQFKDKRTDLQCIPCDQSPKSA